MKVYVLFYKRKENITGKWFDLNHFKFFIYKQDLAKWLLEQDDNLFYPIAIRKINASKSAIVDKNYIQIKTNLEKVK